jgi:hypothetical protein
MGEQEGRGIEWAQDTSSCCGRGSASKPLVLQTFLAEAGLGLKILLHNMVH